MGNATRPMPLTRHERGWLFNINQQRWDDELLTLFDIPKSLLPTVLDNCAQFGFTDLDLLLGHKIPITAMIGDQQAAAVGQACIEPGMVKSTYGTGCFMLLAQYRRSNYSFKKSTVSYHCLPA